MSDYRQAWEQDRDEIDDVIWDFARGRSDVRRVHDPLVTRILELRGHKPAGPPRERRLREPGSPDPDSPAARRLERAERAAERLQGSLTSPQRAALAQHEADMRQLRERFEGGGV